MIEQRKNLNLKVKPRRSDKEKIEQFFALEHEFEQKMRQKGQKLNLWKTEMADLGWL